MPGFVATRALSRVGAQRLRFRERPAVGAILPAVPGGPGNVPVGYNRECKRVPYTVCVGNRCWTEYGWVCTFTPIARMQ